MSQAQLSDKLAITGDAPPARPLPRKRNLDWVGLVPFFLFVTLFLILPSLTIFIRSFQAVGTGDFTFDNIVQIIARADLRNAYKTSLTISLITAIGGSIFGFLLAYAVCLSGMPPGFRTFLLTFSGVASNFAGVPAGFCLHRHHWHHRFGHTLDRRDHRCRFHEAGFTIYNIPG